MAEVMATIDSLQQQSDRRLHDYERLKSELLAAQRVRRSREWCVDWRRELCPVWVREASDPRAMTRFSNGGDAHRSGTR